MGGGGTVVQEIKVTGSLGSQSRKKEEEKKRLKGSSERLQLEMKEVVENAGRQAELVIIQTLSFKYSVFWFFFPFCFFPSVQEVTSRRLIQVPEENKCTSP